MPVQYSYTSTPPIGRTACTEPQCLYKGAISHTSQPNLFALCERLIPGRPRSLRHVVLIMVNLLRLIFRCDLYLAVGRFVSDELHAM